MFQVLSSMLRGEQGATMVEYALLVSLIAIVAFVAVQALGINVNTLYSTVAGSV